MAKKGTEHEKILRVHEIYRLLVKGASRYRILRHATEKWQVSERTGETYLAEARQLLTRDLEIERPKWLEQSIAEMQASALICTQGSLSLLMTTKRRSLASLLAMAPARPGRCALKR
jgi:hypothetical protein